MCKNCFTPSPLPYRHCSRGFRRMHRLELDRAGWRVQRSLLILLFRSHAGDYAGKSAPASVERASFGSSSPELGAKD